MSIIASVKADRTLPLNKYATMLIDLDGTIIDPAAGMIECCRYALERIGVMVSEDFDLNWIIGPSLRSSFLKLVGSAENSEEALRLYRERYAESGLFNAVCYSDVITVLVEKARSGTRLILCTAKPRIYAERIVDHFGLRPMLSGIYGPDLNGNLDDKGDLIEHLLKVEGLYSDEVCMVGDRKYDVHAAKQNGVPAIGVLWGYGSERELTDAGATLIIRNPSELL